jgi:hypothetical protein
MPSWVEFEPAVIPLSVIMGDTETVTFRFVDDDGPIDVSGRTYAAQIKVSSSDEDPLATFNVDMSDAADGVVVCSLSATTTTGLSPLNGVWDCQETNGTIVTTLAGGPVRVRRSVTEP